MMNQDNPYAMNQTCKVCGEPAAGFHFGAFTCEGCKSFFGRSYNNLSSISDCKNNGECVINKKNRTACKACRLRKCLMVGMSKSGSRYGRRSNWFKIHCLLQEQQQQAAAAMAAHQNSQQQSHGTTASLHNKPPGLQTSATAAAALGMLGHAGAYPGLYPPRTKEELMMLSLEEYAKHPAPSPSVSSPDSHNSDSSVEINGRTNASLLHLNSKHTGLEVNSATASSSIGPPPSSRHPAHLRKELPPFLPLPFPALSPMPVMPPPSFLPPSHLLFPGYHPALYQHAHAGLLKASPEQQAAAAAVHQLFNNTPRFHPTTITTSTEERKFEDHKQDTPGSDALNNNHIPNGSKAAEELTKRFYLDAVLKSQQQSPPPMVTKIPNLTKHDHSISALVTPNSESGRNHSNTSRQSNEEELEDEEREREREHLTKSINDSHSNGGQDSNEAQDEEEEEDLVVSMTPPRSPIDIEQEQCSKPQKQDNSSPSAQDNPIDLSMKTVSSVSSCLSHSNRCDSSSEQENDSNGILDHTSDAGEKENWKSHENFIINNNNNNNNDNEDDAAVRGKGVKRKFTESSIQQSTDEVEVAVDKVLKKTASALDLTNKL